MLARLVAGSATVREFLPALVQARHKSTPRGRRLHKALSSVSHALSAACGRDAGRREHARLRLEALRATLRSGSSAAADPRRSAGTRRPRRHDGSRRCAPADRANAGAIPSGLRTAVEDRGEVRPTSAPKPKPKRSRRLPYAFVAVTPTGLRNGSRRNRGAHRGELLAAAADRVSRHVTGGGATNLPAPPQGMAPRGCSSAGIWGRAGRRRQRGQQ